jgi:hypothetical protein
LSKFEPFGGPWSEHTTRTRKTASETTRSHYEFIMDTRTS